MNRLSREKSPYLLQHSLNPVDWYPWGEEAFLKAKAEDKPVFLSIGYSTCHWCHVMAEESFENEELAAAFNRDFVCIKVDREERPDIDAAYMGAVQLMTGAGGWPLNVFLTPDKRPFYGGTYFAPARLAQLLRLVAGKWKDERKAVELSAEQITGALKALAEEGGEEGEVTAGLFSRAFAQLASRYDAAFGGLGTAPKFPAGHNLSFLLLHFYRTGDKKALAMAENTLEHMAAGGLFDHLGGGFHRYSTDREWFLPHFEKMLYDQALLADAYLEAYQLTGRESYAETARRVFGYVLRDLAGPGGGFCCAEDADSAPDAGRPSEKTEGAYYVWSKDELKAGLGADAELFAWRYGVKEEGNVAVDPRGEFGGKNVLAEARSLKETAERFGRTEEEARAALLRAREKLFKARALRPRPHLDDKVLTDWNALMISSLAKGAGALGEPRLAAAAQKAADFILARLMAADGTLLHRFRDGAAGIPGFLDDYAFFINALLDLYEAVPEPRYLERAVALAARMRELFEDKAGGGFFLSAANAEAILPARDKDYYDGALPSGNSMAALCLARLYQLTRREEYETARAAALNGISGRLAASPGTFTRLLSAVDAALTPGMQVVIAAGTPGDLFINEAAALVRRRYLPGKLLLVRVPGADGMAALAPWIKGMEAAEGKTTVYVCAKRVCLPPVTDLEALEKTVAEASGGRRADSY